MIENPALISVEEYRAALRGDFHTFMRRCFAELNSGAPFLSNWHLALVAAKLPEVYEGRICRLIINIPPRSLKSLLSSVAFPAWLLGYGPSVAIINVTYGQELSDKFARDCRAIMSTRWYQSVFVTRLVSPRSSLQELVTTHGGIPHGDLGRRRAHRTRRELHLDRRPDETF